MKLMNDRRGPAWRWTAVTLLLGAVVLVLKPGCGNPGIPGVPGGGGGGGGNTVNPVGLFFNRFSVTLGGTEIVQVLSTSQSRVYLVSDLRGEGVIAQITTGGVVTVQDVISGAGDATGSGQFTTNSKNFTMSPVITIPGRYDHAPFDYVGNRIIGTGTDFPLEASAVSANSAVVGDYDVVVTGVNPETGAAQGSTTNETVTLSLDGDALRITRPSGDYYQGVFIRSDRVAFRSVSGATGRFATFPGSENNVNLDMVGLADINSTGRLAVTLVFQDTAVRGSQTQSELSIVGQRVSDGGGGGGTTFTVEITNSSMEPLNVQLLRSSDANATAGSLVTSGTQEFEGVLPALSTTKTTVPVPCETTGSFVLVATGTIDCDTTTVSQVLRRPADFDCTDTIQFTIMGSCTADFQMPPIIVPPSTGP
jgi:hypothetical protein